MRRALKIIGILALFLIVFSFATPVSAHYPVNMDLEYSNGILSVTITHILAAQPPDQHYIESVEIYVNGNFDREETYTSQPATVEPFTYTYNVTALAGDTIMVTATCNQFGNITETLIVPSGQLPLDVSVETASSEVEATKDVQVTVTVESQGDGVEDADLLPSSDNGGSFTDFDDIGNGEYTSTFTAPDVTSDTTVMITVKVSKAGHSHEEDTVEITVTAKSGGGGGDDDDDEGLPGFESASLLVGLIFVVILITFKKRKLR